MKVLEFARIMTQTTEMVRGCYMRFSQLTLKKALQKVALCLLVFATSMAVCACAGQVKDPQMEKFKKAQQDQLEQLAKEPKVDVLLINKELKKGEVIKEEMIIAHKVPKSKAPSGYLSDKKQIVGKKAAFDIPVGTIITGAAVNP